MLQSVIKHVDEALRQQLAQLPFLYNSNMKLVKATDVYVIDKNVSARQHASRYIVKFCNNFV
jgi:hypothetical protein